MIKKFEDFTKKEKNDLESLRSCINKRDLGRKGIFVFSGEDKYEYSFAEDTVRQLVEEYFVSKGINMKKGFKIIYDIEDENGLYKSLYFERNGIIVFSKEATDKIFSQDGYINMIKQALDKHSTIYSSSESAAKTNAHGESTGEYYSDDALYVVAGSLPVGFNFEGLIIFITDKNEEEFGNKFKSITYRCETFNLNLQ